MVPYALTNSAASELDVFVALSARALMVVAVEAEEANKISTDAESDAEAELKLPLRVVMDAAADDEF